MRVSASKLAVVVLCLALLGAAASPWSRDLLLTAQARRLAERFAGSACGRFRVVEAAARDEVGAWSRGGQKHRQIRVGVARGRWRRFRFAGRACGR